MEAKYLVLCLIVPAFLFALVIGDVIMNAVYSHSEAVRHLIEYPEYDDEDEDFEDF